jgi:glycosyltransferase involved in cell wall biosynthesis
VTNAAASKGASLGAARPPGRGAGVLSGVAFFAPAWPPGKVASGITTYVGVLRDELAALGVEPWVIAGELAEDSGDERVISLAAQGEPPGWRPLQALRRRVLSGYARDDRRVRGIVKALRRISGRGVGLLEMEESFGWAREVARARVAPVVARLHGPWFLNGAAMGVPRDARFRQRDRDERRGLVAADAISAPCRDVLERSRRHFDLPLEGAVVIPNPIAPVPDPARWQLAASDPDDVVFVGRFDRHKGGDMVIEAYAQVVARRPGTRLTFVGPDLGFRADDGRSWDIESFAADRLGPARPGLTCLGRQPLERVQELRRRARVTVVASRYENFPYTALEALATGCPLVSTDAGGLAEVVQDGRNGLTCVPGDPGALAAAILALLQDPDRAAWLGEQAARDVVERYAPADVARRTLELHREVAARWRAP